MPAVLSKMTFARLSPAARNRIIGMRIAGAPRDTIRKTIRKSDGSTASLRAIDGVWDKFQQTPDWEGTDSAAGGRPRALSLKQEQAVLKILIDDVGKFVVSARYVKKKLPELRSFHNRTITRTFTRLGYAYRDRRRKAAIEEKYKPGRLTYAAWLLKQDQEFLDTFCYVDGTSFFLATGSAQHADQKRACLGRKVWRLEDGSDSLEDHNVGASSYAKAQGQPVKIWGLLGDGHLEYMVLPEVIDAKGRRRTANMNGARYEQMVKKHFRLWKKKMFPRMGKTLLPLVKDFERFLRQPRNLKAEDQAGFKTLGQHSKTSPDLNAIENVWDLLQDRLLLTAPVEMERRADFVKRLRRTATWMNNNAREHMRGLSRNQKKRAKQVLKLQGARCSY